MVALEMPTFAERLKELRQDAGLSQTGLARKVGIPHGTLKNYEQGIRSPSWDVFLRIVAALEADPAAFMDCDEIKAAKAKRRRAE